MSVMTKCETCKTIPCIQKPCRAIQNWGYKQTTDHNNRHRISMLSYAHAVLSADSCCSPETHRAGKPVCDEKKVVRINVNFQCIKFV